MLLTLFLLVSASTPLVRTYDMSPRILRIREVGWRAAAAKHQNRIRELLLPGLSAPLPSIGDNHLPADDDWKVALDPKHPVYNFLIEYYGLKGVKGTKRLARWSPTPDLHFTGGVLLENASEQDLGGILHFRGAFLRDDGILYSPSLFFGKGDSERTMEAARAATPFLWYRAILQQTIQAEPILHCHGLHEWAMQYQPAGASKPPSAKYQSHLSLRVDQDTINGAVERKGIHCTHVDALRFFAPPAAPLNHHGASLQRTDQLRLEQPACVHAQMDLLKIALRLQPFLGAELLQAVLDVALVARRLDVAASPYDVVRYGIHSLPVETAGGRSQYRKEQTALMKRAEPVRHELLRAYESFLELAFDTSALALADASPKRERFAKAEPGGLPWRHSLVAR
jgi:hypothetical protein